MVGAAYRGWVRLTGGVGAAYKGVGDAYKGAGAAYRGVCLLLGGLCQRRYAVT